MPDLKKNDLNVFDTAFFGGSFDPPHAGHLGVAQGALTSGRCRRVLWVPAWSPAHKQGRARASFADRMEMVRTVVAGQAGMDLSGIEGALQRSPSYTFEVLEALNAPGNPPVKALLIGADSLLDLHLWHRAEELVREYGVLTYPREGFGVTIEALEKHWPQELAEKLLSGVIPGIFFKISSTAIKKSMANFADRYNINTGDLLPDVADLIRRRGLYRDPSTLNERCQEGRKHGNE